MDLPPRPTRSALAPVVCAVTLIIITGCSGPSAGPSEGTAAESSYEIVSDAQVKSGLTKVTAIMATLKARRSVDEADARRGLEDMYTNWFAFEGTIRKNDQDLYLQMEDGLVSVKIGVQENRPAKVDEGVAEFQIGRTAYLKLHGG